MHSSLQHTFGTQRVQGRCTGTLVRYLGDPLYSLYHQKHTWLLYRICLGVCGRDTNNQYHKYMHCICNPNICPVNLLHSTSMTLAYSSHRAVDTIYACQCYLASVSIKVLSSLSSCISVIACNACDRNKETTFVCQVWILRAQKLLVLLLFCLPVLALRQDYKIWEYGLSRHCVPDTRNTSSYSNSSYVTSKETEMGEVAF